MSAPWCSSSFRPVSRALYTGYHLPAAPDSVHFCRANGYFFTVVFLVVYFILSRHNAVSSVLLSRLAQHAENGRSYFGCSPQKRSLRPDRPVTIKVQCRPTRGVNIFLDPCCFFLPSKTCIKGVFFPLCSIPENISQKMYRSFSRFFSSHATFSHVQACFFTYLHHICMLVASA